MNQDKSELDKFNNAADSWWDPKGHFRPLHEMNPVRLSWISQYADLKNRTVLDVGCGGGLLSEALSRAGAHVTGIDLAENALETAIKHSRESGLTIRYLTLSAENLAEKEPQQYDVVTCMELLEHVPDPFSIVKACSELVKPGGHVFFSTLNRNIKSLCHAIIGAEYVMRLLPKGTHRFDKFITPAELAGFVRACGMNVTAITGVTCDLRARKFRLDNDTRINYMLVCNKPF